MVEKPIEPGWGNAGPANIAANIAYCSEEHSKRTNVMRTGLLKFVIMEVTSRPFLVFLPLCRTKWQEHSLITECCKDPVVKTGIFGEACSLRMTNVNGIGHRSIVFVNQKCRLCVAKHAFRGKLEALRTAPISSVFAPVKQKLYFS